ncbi:MAG: hypothetical protein CMJ49_07300 [Planctomycetaceae bacterium]|nr:hypothetical protein [Planctomycetaceae bacterium]
MSDANTIFDLTERKGIVFGAAGGIGATICPALVRAGATLAMCDINADKAAAVCDDAQPEAGRSCAIACDVTQPDSVQQAVNEAADRFGQIDFVVNLTFFAPLHPIVDMPADVFEQTIRVCLTGAFNISHAVGPIMIQQGAGAVVHFSSIAGAAALGRGTGAYAASKAGINALVRELAIEWGPHNIRVNAIAPCQTRTEPLMRILDNPDFGGRDILLPRMLAKIPLGRLAETEDMIGPTMFLISDASKMVTGHVLYADGGYMAQ